MAISALDQIQQAYIAYYGRPADPNGLTYWAGKLTAAGGDLNVIINAFGNSAESTTLYGGSSLAQQVNKIYNTLFGRDADVAGLNFYVQAIQKGTFTLASVALNIFNGAQAADKVALQDKLAYANAFTADLNTTQRVVGYSGDAAAQAARDALATVKDDASLQSAMGNLDTTVTGVTSQPTPGKTFTLTTGVDNFVGTDGNDTFNATLGSNLTTGPTLNAFDSIDGGKGNNTLNIVDQSIGGFGPATGDILPVGVSIKNVQTINLSTATAAGSSTTNTFDVSGVAGLTALNVSSQNGTGTGDFIKAAKTTNVTDTVAGNSYVKGGNAVTVNAQGNVTVTGAAGAVNVTDKAAGVISITGGTTVNVKASAAGNNAIQIGANPAGQLTVDGNSLNSAALAQLPTGNVTVNESSTTNGVTSFGNGAGYIYTNGATNVSVTGTSINTITDVQTTSNQAGTGTVGTSTLASVTLDGVRGNTTITSDALTSLTIQDNDNVVGNVANLVTVNNAKAHALALTAGANLVTADGVNVAAPTVETANVADATATAVSVATTGSVKVQVNLNAAAATSLSFSNSAAVQLLGDFANLGKVTTVTATGSGALNLGDTSASAVTTIDASAATGGVSAAINGAEVFKGGAGDDVVTLKGAMTKTSGGSISLGAGNNSLLAGGGSIGAGVTIDGGAGGHNTISASLVNAGNSAGIKNFQVLDVSSFGSGAGNGSLDASLLATAVSGVAISTAMTNGVATLQNLAAAVTVTDTLNNDNSTLVLTHAAGSAVNSLAVNFANATVNGSQTLDITSTGDATVTVTSGGAKGAENFLYLDETDNHLSSLTITGSNYFELDGISTNTAATATTATTVASALTVIDASATTGGVWIEAGANGIVGNVTTTYTGLTIKGGVGGDWIQNDADSGVIIAGATSSKLANTLTVTGSKAVINASASAGADTLNLNGFSGTATLGSGKGVVVNVVDDTFGALSGAKLGEVVTVNLGSGTATVNDALAYHVTASATSAATNGDLLVLNGSLSGNSLAFATVAAGTTLGAATSVAGAQTFDQAVFLAESATANTVTWFQFGGNTYVEHSGAAGGTADNHVVKIVGLVDLSHAAVDAANGAIHFA